MTTREELEQLSDDELKAILTRYNIPWESREQAIEAISGITNADEGEEVDDLSGDE